MQQRILLAIAAAVALLAIGLALFWQPGESPRPTAGGDFRLQSADGPVALEDYRGKVVLLYFGYTFCPDICPTELTSVAAALKLLAPAESERVAMLFVSVDPERDTPEHLKNYTAFFHPAMVGITGAPETVAEVAGRYGVYYARQKTDTAGGYVVDHTAELFLIDRDGRLVARLAHALPPEQVVAEIRKHLN